MLKTVKNLVLELLFPTSCVDCQQPGDLLCERCYESISIDYDALPLKFPYVKGVFVASSLNQKIIENAIYKFKYNFVYDLAGPLSQVLADFLIYKTNRHFLLDIDLIIPVPLSRKRYLYRGFNQSEILGRILSGRFGWELQADIVQRKHTPKTQVELGYQDRLKNVKGVFSVANEKVLKNKKVLIIDDVLTTGSTISELAKVLKKAGVSEVWALVIAANH